MDQTLAAAQPRERVVLGLFGAWLVAGPQLLGGEPAWATSLLAAVGLVVLALTLAAGLSIPRSSGLTAMLVGLGVTAIQLAPVPRVVAEFLFPERLALVDATFAVSGGAPAWVPATLDPGGTEVAFLRGVALGAAWMTGSALSLRFGRRRVLAMGAASALVVVLVALMHELTDSSLLFGVYEHPWRKMHPVAPLTNGNHFAGFAAFGAILALGQLFESDTRAQRLGWMGAAAVSGAMTAFSGSRGGAAGLLIGLLLLSFGMARRRRSRRQSWSYLAAGAVLVGVAGVYLGGEALMGQLRHGDLSKLDLTLSSLGLAFAYPTLGVGRGAFGPAFTQVVGSEARYSHPENLLAQWSSEWGIPVTILLLVLLVPPLVRALLSRRASAVTGAAAVISLAVHDLADFALEMTGIAMVAAACAGAVVSSSRQPELPPRPLRFGVVAVATVALTLMTFAAPSLPYLASEELREHAAEWDLGRNPGELDAALQNHPLEPSVVVLAAWQAVRSQRPDAAGWLNRAMTLAPRWPSPHVLAARWLWSVNASRQAALEIREAERLSPGAGVEVACEWGKRVPDAPLTSAAPTDAAAGAFFLDALGQCLGFQHPASPAVDQAAEELDPTLAGPPIRRASRADGAAERVTILEAALARQEGVEERVPTLVALARALHQDRRLERARAALERVPAERRGVDWLETQALVAMSAGDDHTASAAFQRLRGLARGSSGRLASIAILEGKAELARGNPGRALARFRDANRLAPNVATARLMARASEQAGQWTAALDAWQRACEDSGSGSSDCRRRDAARAHLAERGGVSGQPTP